MTPEEQYLKETGAKTIWEIPNHTHTQEYTQWIRNYVKNSDTSAAKAVKEFSKKITVMTKDIRDYLHLYLGCEVEWGFDGRKKKGVLIGKDERYGWQIFDPLNVIVPYQYCRTDLLKPILRPLSDMTEEEVLELCKTASPTFFGDYRFAKWEANRSPHEMCHWTVTNKNSIYCFNVSSVDGDVYISDEDGDIDLVSIDGNYRFWYLKKGFDIFGLIEAGLAINKTKFEK